MISPCNGGPHMFTRMDAENPGNSRTAATFPSVPVVSPGDPSAARTSA